MSNYDKISGTEAIIKMIRHNSDEFQKIICILKNNYYFCDSDYK